MAVNQIGRRSSFCAPANFLCKRNWVMAPLRWSTINTVKRCRTLCRARHSNLCSVSTVSLEQKTAQRSNAQENHISDDPVPDKNTVERQDILVRYWAGGVKYTSLVDIFLATYSGTVDRQTNHFTCQDRIEAQNSYTLLFRVVNRS